MSLKRGVALFFSSDYNKLDVNYHKHIIILIFLLCIVFLISLLFLVNFFIFHNPNILVLNIITFFVAIFLIWYLKKTHKTLLVGHILTLFFIIMTNLVFYINENQHLTFLWILFIPIFVFFMVGRKWGLRYFFLHSALVFAISYHGLTIWSPSEFDIHSLYRLLIIIITLATFMYFHEKNRQKAYKYIQESLQRENDNKEKLFVQNKTLETLNQELNEYKLHLEEKVQKAINETKDSQALLTQQSKMASMGEMLASVGHQWKQPLAVMSSLNSQIELKSTLKILNEDEIKAHTQSVAKQIKFMSETLSEFSEFFKPDKQKIKFCLEDAINDVLKLFNQIYISQGITINVDLSKCLKIINHKNEFRQVLVNIINNARDAILEQKIKDMNIDIRIYDDGTHAYCEISDHAGGIKKEILSSLFDAYTTSTSTKQGSGIGLYMSKTIIEDLMQGTLSASNTSDGASFLISLPLQKDE